MVDTYLKNSIQQYRAILDHADHLDVLLSQGDPERLCEYTVRLHELQEEAGLNDRELLAEVARDSTHRQAHPLFRERMQLLEQIVEMNHLLLPRVRGMMAVAAAELTQLKEGRAAVSGYHQVPARSKKSIRGVG